MFVVIRLNQCETVHTKGTSPRQILTGVVLDINKDLPLSFGQLVEVINPYQNASMEPRSESAIYIGPVNNSAGSHYFCNKNGSIIMRSEWNITYENDCNNIDFICDDYINVDALMDDDNEDINVQNMMESQNVEETVMFKPNFADGIYFNPNIIPKNNDESIGNNGDDNSSNSDDYDSDDDRTIVNDNNVKFSYDDDDIPRYWKEVNKIELIDKSYNYDDQVIKESITKEINNMKYNNVWTPMSNYENHKTIPCKIFVKVKKNANGEPIKVKARMTAGSHLQRDIEDAKAYSPTSSINTIIMLCTLHTKRNSKFSVIDIGAAYLNAKIDDDIYMKIDADIVNYMKANDMIQQQHIRDDGSVVVKLVKALYGTKQAGRAWYNKLDSDIRSLGYQSNNIELGIYTKNVNDKVSNIMIYVDDIIIMCDDLMEHERLINEFKRMYNDITISAKYANEFEYLGLNFMTKDETLHVNMSGYVKKILEERTKLSEVESPYTNNLFNNRKLELLDSDEQTKLRSDIAKILYLAKRTRPDLLLPTIVLSTRVNKFNVDDKSKVGRIYNYLYKTQNLELKLKDSNIDDVVKIYAHVDASYGTYEDGKGQSAYGFSFGNGMFMVKSKKQKSVGKSSTEAEIIAIDDASCEAVHLINLLNACGFKCERCELNEDNASAIKIINGGIEVMNKTKYMRVRMAHIKELIENGGIILKYCPTEEMIVDILTKPISGSQFRKLRDKLLGYD